MAVRGIVNLHHSESEITFTARDESLPDWEVSATLLLMATVTGEKRPDDQLIIAVLVLICF